MDPSIKDLISRLKARTVQKLPSDWQKGLKCPDCKADADRQKCMHEFGSGCPRNDPDNYDPSPYVVEPDQDCVKAADLLEKMEVS